MATASRRSELNRHAVARIEIGDEGFAALAARRAEIASALKRIGFAYAALDLDGYRSGSLNEVLPSCQS